MFTKRGAVDIASPRFCTESRLASPALAPSRKMICSVMATAANRQTQTVKAVATTLAAMVLVAAIASPASANPIRCGQIRMDGLRNYLSVSGWRIRWQVRRQIQQFEHRSNRHRVARRRRSASVLRRTRILISSAGKTAISIPSRRTQTAPSMPRRHTFSRPLRNRRTAVDSRVIAFVALSSGGFPVAGGCE